ncbi:hypothetical protein QBC36DRAFT_327779 [Triangularia setosa]|uniref:Carrier domain-containing protein n=1 Tax=Triangularia setosa TaxID=2587417 RepID=A0AAN7A8E1_9PEZI|nr:hypothetical protein QBC36DRAFT_327779 [Podospora setosa]
MFRLLRRFIDNSTIYSSIDPPPSYFRPSYFVLLRIFPIYNMPSLTWIVDQLAAEIPHDTWVKTPLSSAKIEEITWQDITFQQLSQAVDRLAHWIDQHLGPAALGQNEPLAYTGINDIRYPIVILAALKTGYKGLLLSPRNSVEGQCALITSTNCSKLLHSQERSGQAQEIGQTLSHVNVLQLPDLESFLEFTSHVAPYRSKCGDAMDDLDTAMILHSSGTTGLPKPIPIKAGVLSIASKLVDALPTPKGRLNTHDPLYTTPLILSMPPFFHAFGMNLLVRSLFYRRPLVLLPSTTPPTAELMLHAIQATGPTAVVCTPSILEDVCRLPRGLDILKSSDIQCVYSGGAPLARSCGDLIAEQLSPDITLVNGIGTTEIWNATSYIPQDPKDWEYFEWNPASGIVMEAAVDGDDKTAELVIKRMPGEQGRFQFVFYNFPELEEWRTKDLFERHPTREGLWRYAGRVDDIVVLSNGEKLNPVTFEKMVEGHPLVKGAVLVGSGQFQTGLIVEVYDQALDAEVVVEQIWETVEGVNEQYPAHAKVWRPMVAVARGDKPFPRTPKGTVMRMNTYRLYQAEIEEMYAKVAAVNGGMTEGDVPNEAMVLGHIRKAVNSVNKRCGDVRDGTNLFSLGFDSLQVLQLVMILKNTVPPSLCSKLSPSLVYQNPSISQLCRTLCSSPTATTAPRAEKFEALIRQYTPSLTRPLPFRPKPKGFTVILTGSTGTLGASLLSSLLASPTITQIYCLNRSKPTTPNNPRVTYLQTDLTHPTLGLSPKAHSPLEHAHLLIHSAWPVNFNLPLDSFLPSLSGTASLMSLNPAKFVFVSSIATAMNSSSPVPEIFTPDHNLPLPTGYGESKHLASCILANSPIPTTILRVGQLAGRADGSGRAWNKHEWLPSLIQTSLNLGMIPSSLGGSQKSVDWIPVDLAAEAILELGMAAGDNTTGVMGCYNVVNPSSADWEGEMVAAVQGYAKKTGRGELRVVRTGEWLDGLAGKDDAERYPALKLKEFFEGWRGEKEGGGVFETDKAKESSRTMREMEAVSGEMMERWLDAWAF